MYYFVVIDMGAPDQSFKGVTALPLMITVKTGKHCRVSVLDKDAAL